MLHPHIKDFLALTRKYFSGGIIKILTNGTLLLNMKDDFWETCHETKTHILYSKYPVYYDDEKIKIQADKYKIPIEIAEVEEGKEYVTKTMVHEPVDIAGKQDVRKNFYSCSRVNDCITLKHGKLYTCNRAAHMHLLKDYFGFDISIDETNGIDIYKAKTAEEILEYLIKPIPMCAYCDKEHITMGHK